MTHKPDDERDDLADNGVLDGGISVETSSITLMPLPLPTTTVSIAFPAADEDDDLGDDVVEGEVSLEDTGLTDAELIDDSEESISEESEDTGEGAAEDDTAIEEPDQGAEGDVEDAAEIVGADAHDDAGDVTESDTVEPIEDELTISEPDVVAPVASVVEVAPVAAAPLTRRAAATGPLRAQRRTQPKASSVAVEARESVSADKPMPSRRIGEVAQDAVRETPDLLTSDRLVEDRRLTRPEPEGAWAHLLYSLSGGRINIGDSKKARARKQLDTRIAAPLVGGARFVAVTSRKGGVGKTTVTTLLGMALASAREDRVVAVDANPDRGTLADRISRQSGKTVRDLVRERDNLRGFNDVSDIVARDETRLDVLASDTDPHVSEAFSADEYYAVADVAAHYYSIVLTDTGTGIVHSVMGATLDLSNQLVVVTGPSVDESRLASETLTWLEMNGFAELVRDAIVVVNSASPGAPMVRLNEIERHFGSRVREVVRIPYDSLIAAGGAIVFNDLQPATREAARTLAARVVEGLRAPREA